MANESNGAGPQDGWLQKLLRAIQGLFGGAPTPLPAPAPPTPAPASATPPAAPTAPAAAPAAPSTPAPQTQAKTQMSDSTVVANPGWEDILGIFNPFVEQMMWRFNLASYEDVRANATIILGRINGGGMPPPNYPPLSDDQIRTYTNWVNNDCPLNAPPPPTSTTAAVPATTLAGNQQVRPVKFP